MTNNDIFKKLRVALMLRDDQIVEILELVDFRITKSELGAFFRDEKHENYMECGDQVLRNFLNGLVIHLRGTKENPKNPNEVLASHKHRFRKKKLQKTDRSLKPSPKILKDQEEIKVHQNLDRELKNLAKRNSQKEMENRQ